MLLQRPRKDSPALAKLLDDFANVRKVYQEKVKKCRELGNPQEQR